jgi:glycosyltransferase involved in cell wall biosynthesis
MVLCSIVTPCYNAEHFIDRTINSVRRQTFDAWEYVIVDDGSTDNSAGVVERHLAAEPRLSLLRQSNAGVAAARNAGYRAAAPESRYLLFLDHDDRLEPEALERMVTYLEERPAVGAVYCAWRCIDTNDRPLTGINPYYYPRRMPSRLGLCVLPDDHPETPFATLLACFMAFPSATLVRRSVFAQTPGFDPRYRYNSDKEIVLQMALRAPVHFLPETLMLYRRHETNMSSDAGMFTELETLLRRWWHDERLTPRQRQLVRNAILFDRFLSAGRDASAVLDVLTQRELLLACQRAWHATKKVGRLSFTAAAWLSSQTQVTRPASEAAR